MTHNESYNKVQDVLKDIALVWSNCRKYNERGSKINKQADYLEKKTKRIFEDL